MAEIYNDKSNTLLSGTSGDDSIQNGGYWYEGNEEIWHDGGSNVTINAGAGNDSVENYGSEVTINTGEGNDYVWNNGSSSVTINTGAGNDSVENYGSSVTINTGEGNDSVENYGSEVTINTGEGNDEVYNPGLSVTINTGAGNDSVDNWYGDSVTINTGEGNDYVDNSGSEVTINTGEGDDSVENYGSSVTITGGKGNDSVDNWGSSVTITGGKGNDAIYNNYNISGGYAYDDNDGSNVLFKYSSGDGNDIIYGFKADSTLSISGGSYSTKKSGSDIIVTVWNGKISLMGAASLDKVNIKGTKTSSSSNSSNNIFSKVNVTDFGGKSKQSVRNKALTGFETLLKTDMSDVILKNVDGLKTLDAPTQKKLSSLSSIFKLAGKANDSFDVLGNMCSSAETFLGLVKSKKRDANWGKQVSDCVKNLMKFGNAVLKLSDKELAKSLGLGLGGSLFGLAGSIIATTDGINDKERDNIVKDLFTVSGEFAKLVIPNAKVPSMEINLVVATASALYMGSVQTQKSIEKYSADGSFTLTDFRDTKIDSVMVSLDEFARKMTLGASDVFFNWLDKKLGGSSYSDMTYIEKAAEGYKILFNYIGDKSVKLAKSIGNAIGNWWTKITDSLNQKGLNLKGDSKNNILLGSEKKDTLSGGAGNDKIYGNAGNDSLVGGDGNDTLNGAKGNDTLTGSKGKDVFISGTGKDVITDYATGDKISMTAAITKTSVSGSDVVFTMGKNSLTVKNAKGKSLSLTTSAGKNLSTIIGGSTTLTVTDKTKSPVTVGSAIKTINASKRTTAVKITGNSLANTITGGSKNDSLYGAAGNDSILGNAGNDKIYGGKGNDTLTGGKGNDSLWGDAGKDTFIYANGDGKDVIYGFDNTDMLKITETFTGTYNKSKKEVYFKVGSTSNAITLKNFTATTFNVNGTSYKLSSSKLVKK